MDSKVRMGRLIRNVGGFWLLAAALCFILLIISTGQKVQPGFQEVFFGLLAVIFYGGVVLGPMLLIVGALVIYGNRR